MIQAGHGPAATVAGTRAWGAQAVPFRHGAIRLRGGGRGPGPAAQASGRAPGRSGRIEILGATYGRVAAPAAAVSPNGSAARAAEASGGVVAREPVGHGAIRLRGMPAPVAVRVDAAAAPAPAAPAREPVGHGTIRLRGPR